MNTNDNNSETNFPNEYFYEVPREKTKVNAGDALNARQKKAKMAKRRAVKKARKVNRR